VEVKLRSSASPCHPLESVTPKKVERLKRTALLFLQSIDIKYSQVRFDVIAITGGEVLHLINAF